MRVETTMLSPDTAQYAGTVAGGMRVDAIAAAARKVEELGFDGATTPEAGHDPFVPLAIAAEHTRRISLATNVAIAFPRSPLVTAQVAWDLQALSGGRFQLGLGTQVKGHNERRYAAPWTAPPGPRMRDYLLCLKAMFASFQDPKKPTYFTGKHYQFSMMTPFFNPGPIEHPHIPIYLAAVNPYMCRLGGELCDGIRLHPLCTFRYTRDVVLPAIAEGSAKAGRQPGNIDVVGCPFLAVSRSQEGLAAAKAAVKQRIAFYSSTRTYHSVLKFHGWADLGMQLHQLSLEGKWREMPRLISDEMMEEFAIVAVGDEFTSKVKERCQGLFSTFLIDGAPELQRDEGWLRRSIEELHRP
ncbi:MAG TPA: TIGR03617 family F420-dependent LLM class oxidoreductase [Candidatus Binatia bacterium]|jgi:probable F420-dependent oxidoreductase